MGHRVYKTWPQCAVVYRRGKRMGLRCKGYAKFGPYCSKHKGDENLGERVKEEAKEGRARYWAAMRQAAQQGLITTMNAGVSESNRRRAAAAKAKKEAAAQATAVETAAVPAPDTRGAPGVPKTAEHREKIAATQRTRRDAKHAEALQLIDAVPPQTETKQLAMARRNIEAEQRALPAAPDKPFEEMEPHEKLIVITGMSLDFIKEVLAWKVDEKLAVVAPKLAQMKLKAATDALSLRTKIDANALAAKKADRMMELLEQLKGERAVVIDG